MFSIHILLLSPGHTWVASQGLRNQEASVRDVTGSVQGQHRRQFLIRMQVSLSGDRHSQAGMPLEEMDRIRMSRSLQQVHGRGSRSRQGSGMVVSGQQGPADSLRCCPAQGMAGVQLYSDRHDVHLLEHERVESVIFFSNQASTGLIAGLIPYRGMLLLFCCFFRAF